MKNGNAESKQDRSTVLNHLKAAWEQHPHLRLCQLIENAARPEQVQDLFYITDEQLMLSLGAFSRRSSGQ